VLAPLLPKLFAAYPALTLDLVLADDQVDLVADQIDLAVRFGAEPEGDVIVHRLASRRFKVCASPGYIEASGTLGCPEELEGRECLLFSLPGYRSRWLFRRGTEPPVAIPVRGRLLVSHGLTMTACAVEGLGPALLPDWLCRRELDAGSLIDLFPDYEVTATEFDSAAWLVHPSRSYIPMKVRVLIDFLQQEVAGFA
jgi:DNA-binding transcriptional LysR family regulator